MTRLEEINYKNKSHIAIIDGPIHISYEELDHLSDQLCNWILEKKLSPSTCIAIEIKKSWKSIVAMLGILKARCCFTYIDPKLPSVRKQHYFAISKASFCLNDLPLLKGIPSDSPKEKSSKDLCYIYFTSGSTGQPKGACFDHAKAMQFIKWASIHLPICNTDKVCGLSSFSFDISLYDIFATLHAGATLVLIEDKVKYFAGDLYETINRNHITIVQTVPTLWEPLAEMIFPQIKSLIFTGQHLSPKLLQTLENNQRTHYPQCQFYNLYGQTEANSYLLYNFTKDFSYPVAISKIPLPSYTFVKDNVLFIEGHTLMNSYCDQEQIQQLNTKDIVKIENDKCFLLGRVDSIIKFKGYRINPVEIENVINTICQNSCLICTEQLIIVIEEPQLKTSTFNAEKQRAIVLDHCMKLLPSYMIPEKIEFMEKLPLSSNGKLDRAHLKSIFFSS